MRSQPLAAAVIALALAAASARAELLKPFVLARTTTGDMAKTVASVQSALEAKAFEIVGSYAPYAGATVIRATNAELKAAARVGRTAALRWRSASRYRRSMASCR